MAVVSERVNATKAPNTLAIDPKTGRSTSPQIAQDRAVTLLNEDTKDQSGFFGSFFSKKKKPGVLENVSFLFPLNFFPLFSVFLPIYAVEYLLLVSAIFCSYLNFFFLIKSLATTNFKGIRKFIRKGIYGNRSN